MAELRKLREKNKISITEEIGKFLDFVNFPVEKTRFLSKKELKYLTGDWFEEYSVVLKTLKCDSLLCGTQIKKQDVSNEFDILFTQNNQLFVIGCKTRIFDGSSEKNILDETLYKITTLRKEFGLIAKSFVFTLSKRGSNKKHIKDSHLKRSELLNIKIADYSNLSNVTDFESFLKSEFK